MDLNIENNIKNNEKNITNNKFSEELKNTMEKNTFFSIDRFEGNFAICENKSTNEIVNIDKSLLPDNCKEGDILKFENGVYVIDKNKSKSEQQEIKNMVDNLFKKK